MVEEGRKEGRKGKGEEMNKGVRRKRKKVGERIDKRTQIYQKKEKNTRRMKARMKNGTGRMNKEKSKKDEEAERRK